MNSLQEEVKDLIFYESEVTPELREACEKQGIKLNIVPDREYEEAIAEGFGAWLIKNYRSVS